MSGGFATLLLALVFCLQWLIAIGLIELIRRARDHQLHLDAISELMHAIDDEHAPAGECD